MKKLLIYLSFISGILAISGCSHLKDYTVWREPSWAEKAGYYESCYPELNINQKADLLIQDMAKAEQDFNVTERFYRSRVIEIYWSGIKIWPVEHVTFSEHLNKKKKSHSNEEFKFETKNPEEEKQDGIYTNLKLYRYGKIKEIRRMQPNE